MIHYSNQVGSILGAILGNFIFPGRGYWISESLNGTISDYITGKCNEIKLYELLNNEMNK